MTQFNTYRHNTQYGVNTYKATRRIALEGLDLAMRITILRVNFVYFGFHSTCHV